MAATRSPMGAGRGFEPPKKTATMPKAQMAQEPISPAARELFQAQDGALKAQAKAIENERLKLQKEKADQAADAKVAAAAAEFPLAESSRQMAVREAMVAAQFAEMQIKRARIAQEALEAKAILDHER